MFDSDGGIKNDVEDYLDTEDNESVASMSDDEEDDYGDILKEFFEYSRQE